MTNNFIFLLKLILAFLPFVLLGLLNGKSNLKQNIRYRQYPMPLVAVLYCVILIIFRNSIHSLCLSAADAAAALLERANLAGAALQLKAVKNNQPELVQLVLFNTLTFALYLAVKGTVLAFFRNRKVSRDSFPGKLIGVFYECDEETRDWTIRRHFGDARKFLKTAYYGGCAVSAAVLTASGLLFNSGVIKTPYYPVFAVIVIGEMAFFIDGLLKSELKAGDLTVTADRSRRIAIYPLLRNPLRALFGDKLSSEGTSVNNGSANGGAVEDVLWDIEENGGHIGKNYASFIRGKIVDGLKPNIDYVRSGYDLSVGKSLLFNTPFYDKLTPYAFYAMNRHILTGGKILIVLGRHGTEEDLQQWCRKGMQEVSNVPDLYQIRLLDHKTYDDAHMPDIGIISRSGVHDLEIHRSNLRFLKKVSLVVIAEPSRLVATAQIGLNLLIKCCGMDREITFCSVDQNCDGLVDSLSHILMTNLTEVTATEYPHGTSSFMCWTADSDYIHHRMVPGISRYLGMGVELSFAALKNQVEKAMWYGGDAYPVLDAHWIAKQYYHDLLEYAGLPATQETFDRYFQTSFNMCNEKTGSYSYITVEDERNNVFEVKRNFATIAEQQGFVNVISSQYMLREYMTDNTNLFNADPKAIPFITADYARTRRNAILSLCLKLCVEGMTDRELERELVLLGDNSRSKEETLWNEICRLFSGETPLARDAEGSAILVALDPTGKEVQFRRSETLCFSRRYSVESGCFENVYSITDRAFSNLILDDLQNAGYVAERDGDGSYLGTELKGHIYQKYLPAQFFTLNGKYYEMVSVTADNRIIVRRASDHINGRLSYRQVRHYTVHSVADSGSMGALKTVNHIAICYQYADFSVATPGYWKLGAYQDFKNGALIELNGIPDRHYFNKQILKLDFSGLGDGFTDSVRKTVTALLNETFVTLFADNQPFIAAVTPGISDLPLTYSMDFGDNFPEAEHCIYILEDSQLDIGLLVAFERNINRIFQIISDYLSWNEEKTEESLHPAETETKHVTLDDCLKELENRTDAEQKPESRFRKIAEALRNLFRRKKKIAVPTVETDFPREEENEEGNSSEPDPMEEPRQVQEEDSANESEPEGGDTREEADSGPEQPDGMTEDIQEPEENTVSTEENSEEDPQEDPEEANTDE